MGHKLPHQQPDCKCIAGAAGRQSCVQNGVRHSPGGWVILSNTHRDGNGFLELFIFNEEFPVSANHQLVLITSLPFVHAARRSYRLSDPLGNSDYSSVQFLGVAAERLVNLIT